MYHAHIFFASEICPGCWSRRDEIRETRFDLDMALALVAGAGPDKRPAQPASYQKSHDNSSQDTRLSEMSFTSNESSASIISRSVKPQSSPPARIAYL